MNDAIWTYFAFIAICTIVGLLAYSSGYKVGYRKRGEESK